jgi:Flp pilus assembly protein TadG
MKRQLTGRKSQRGSAMVEFAIAGIAGVTLLISTVQLSLVMWNYHTLAHAVHETNRYVASHGRSCSSGGNSCSINVNDVATKLKSLAIGIPSNSVAVTLTSHNGTVQTCAPLDSCLGNTTQWPPIANLDNNPGNYSTITARLPLHPAIVALWYGTSGTAIHSVTLPATSKVKIVF